MEDEVTNNLNQDGESSTRENVGIEPTDEVENIDSEAEHQDDDPYGVKKRLGQQAKKHQREMRQMREHLGSLQAQIGGNRDSAQVSPDTNPYPSPGQPSAPAMTEEQRIHMAVRYALGAKDDEEKQAKAAKSKSHVQKQYQRMNDEFDKAADKYDDFDDVVRGDDVPFTEHVRDALLLVDNPADVAYKLGKDRKKLQEIAELHPLDQAREVNKLSFALLGGNTGNKPAGQSKGSNPMVNPRVNPATSGAVTDKTPAADIRARMKAGTWK